VVTVAVGLAASGCGSERPAQVGKARANPHYGAPGAKVAFVAPKRGAATRQPVVVRIRVTGFELDPKRLDETPRQGSGQLQFRMDGGKYDRPRYSGENGRLAVRLGVAGRFSPAVRPTITYEHLPSGRHRLVVYLANNDLSRTGVHASTTFTVTRE
jgi:hypothetical protein